jgi:hypothetical protein
MPYAHIRETTIEANGRLRVEGLPLRAGERVQIVIIPRQRGSTVDRRYPLHGSPVQYDSPFEPATDPEDWEANK